MPAKRCLIPSQLIDSLVETGAITTDPTKIYRVTITIQVGRPVRINVEQFADADAVAAMLREPFFKQATAS